MLEQVCVFLASRRHDGPAHRVWQTLEHTCNPERGYVKQALLSECADTPSFQSVIQL